LRNRLEIIQSNQLDEGGRSERNIGPKEKLPGEKNILTCRTHFRKSFPFIEKLRATTAIYLSTILFG